MKNDFNYKWSKLFASKRFNTKDGIIKLTPEEQQELLDDSKRVITTHHKNQKIMSFKRFHKLSTK